MKKCTIKKISEAVEDEIARWKKECREMKLKNIKFRKRLAFERHITNHVFRRLCWLMRDSDPDWKITTIHLIMHIKRQWDEVGQKHKNYLMDWKTDDTKEKQSSGKKQGEMRN